MPFRLFTGLKKSTLLFALQPSFYYLVYKGPITIGIPYFYLN